MDSFIKSTKKLIKPSNICEECNFTCNTINFQRNFENWTSGNGDIDKFIQDTQLLAHENIKEALEWIPYDGFYNITKSRFDEIYEANWIEGNISHWDDKNQNWKRNINNMIVILKRINNLKNIKLEVMNESHGSHGITQNPETNKYMTVLNDKCKRCNYVCDAIHFQQNFINWTSGNDDIDKFIQYTQLLAHENIKEALEWIPYDRFYNIVTNSFDEICGANWIDGNINHWDDKNQNWNRNNNMIVTLKRINNLKNIALEFMNEIKIDHEFYGITQNPETNNYMMVLNDKCKICNYVCNAINFQQNFINWTSSNDDIDKFIQDIQLSVHYQKKALEWMPYDRFNNTIKSKFCKTYITKWIDGKIRYWNNEKQNWERYDCDT
ncbi:kinase-like domain-containing protein [Rhizophagus irregularis DAOM 181602=DAOM 197198]|uniref:Uncharacterized protein n=1 Tax=Rhizophagus irregularis (strain DAOM 197198w) TaxID=1432141 RepID=A0A015LFH7_RHIIW|nr:hypothetical protein RirG_079620 [Rhizophagus irregularis DAOM 197198w]GBC32138.1 kinase-like domain-containing protein [Rhizophagus irregularis DAOM 181602=DAOM 197198]